MPAPKHAWKTTSTQESKPWGSARVWYATGGFHGKVIHILEGKRTSLKYHRTKDEFFYVLSGMVRVRFGNSKTLEDGEKYPWKEVILKPGDVFNVQSECPYRFQAIEDSTLVEVGDRSNDMPVRLEDDYGRIDEK